MNLLETDGWTTFTEDFLAKENKLQSIKLGMTDPRDPPQEEAFEEEEFNEDVRNSLEDLL